MDGFYCGDAATVALHRKIDRLTPEVLHTPGACLGGRFMATDDPGLLGWNEIDRHVREDGAFVFRMIPMADLPELDAKVGERGLKLFTWRIFSGTAAEVRVRRKALAEDSPAPEIHHTPTPALVSEVMAFLERHGIRPFTGQTLSGAFGPVVLAVVRGAQGQLNAVAFGHFFANRFSPWRKTAWCGLVAVSPEARGRGLGRAVNDAVVEACLSHLGADRVVEFAAEDNRPSRAMIEGSGLRLSESHIVALATAAAERPSR